MTSTSLESERIEGGTDPRSFISPTCHLISQFWEYRAHQEGYVDVRVIRQMFESVKMPASVGLLLKNDSTLTGANNQSFIGVETG